MLLIFLGNQPLSGLPAWLGAQCPELLLFFLVLHPDWPPLDGPSHCLAAAQMMDQ